MIINVLASGSKGNAYFIDNDTPLLLEAGIRFKDIQQDLDFQVSRMAGCLISHEHMDHAKAAKNMLRGGVDCYLSKGTVEALGLCGHRVHVIEALRQFRIRDWAILPFQTIHDATEPLAFLMANRKGDKILYATDTEYIAYRFVGLTHILIECNYSMKILRDNVASKAVDKDLKRRVIQSHMSLETLIDFLKANDLSKIEEIWLLHLSDTNSDAEGFRRTIRELTGKVVKVA